MSEHGKDTDVRPSRLAIAVAIGVLAYVFADSLPFAAGVDPRAGRVVLGVTAATIACWMSAAMPLGVPLWGLVLSSWSLPNST